MPTLAAPVRLRWLTTAAHVDQATFDALLACWRDVSNAGGAVGFAQLPVTAEQVRPVLAALVRSLDPATTRLLCASVEGRLAGWLVLAGHSDPVTAHWARVARVQTSLAYRGVGIGAALMAEVARCARADLGLSHLRLELRGGMGLERFYAPLGWREIGRWPEALRVGPDDVRDEVLMHLPLRRAAVVDVRPD